MCSETSIKFCKYRMSQGLRSIFRDLILELMLSQKRHIHMGPICNGSGVMSLSIVNKLERKEEHCAFTEICCKMYSYRFTVQHSSSCPKCPPSAKINFPTCVTRELVTLQSTAALLMFLAVLRIHWSILLSCSPRVGLVVEQNVTNRMGVRINPTAQFQLAIRVCRFKMLNVLDMVRIHSFCV